MYCYVSSDFKSSKIATQTLLTGDLGGFLNCLISIATGRSAAPARAACDCGSSRSLRGIEAIYIYAG